jgi:glycosyltransferase involved in cell wall biosynthesis
VRYAIDTRLVAYQRGGITTYVRRLAAALAGAGASPDTAFRLLVARRDPAALEAPPGFETQVLWTPPHHPLEEWTLGMELVVSGIDLIHSPDFIPPFRRRCPAVITVHDLAFLRFPDTKTAASLRYYGQVPRAVRDAEAIIAVSRATARDLSELLGVPRDRMRVIHHGVDPTYRPLADRAAVRAFCAQRGLPEEFVLWVGTQEPRKNLPCLFAGFAAAKDRLPPGKGNLVIAGPRGWGFEAIDAAFQEAGIARETTFFGPATEADLVLLYNAAWAFAFPSLYEGFGLPPLEAMACGVPVLASNAPAMPEVLRDAALYFAPGDPEALAELLVRVAHEPALAAALSAAGVAHAAAFRWEATAAATLDLYREVAGA